MARRLLSTYLNDHLAGATAGVELVRRANRSNRGEEEFGPPLGQLCAEIEADKATLERVMERLDVRRDPVKVKAAWLGEKLGRLKPNGQLVGYSPLSRLVELEILCLGIVGKAQMWSALERVLAPEWSGFDFHQLGERAERQRATASELRSKAADVALSPGGRR